MTHLRRVKPRLRRRFGRAKKERLGERLLSLSLPRALALALALGRRVGEGAERRRLDGESHRGRQRVRGCDADDVPQPRVHRPAEHRQFRGHANAASVDAAAVQARGDDAELRAGVLRRLRVETRQRRRLPNRSRRTPTSPSATNPRGETCPRSPPRRRRARSSASCAWGG